MILCMGCMAEINENSTFCPYCGYRRGTPKEEEYFLDPGSILQQRYVIGRVIGHGGFGITYMGYDALLNRKVAIKEFFYRQCVTRENGTNRVKVYTGDASWQFQIGLDSFMAEARQLAGFTKVSEIADIYDCVSENGTGYIIMEFIEGKDIRMILKERGPLPYEETEKIVLSVARGLSEMHQAGIIHRDIAPDNIMISSDGTVKLVDFGAARQVAAAYSQNLSVIFKAGYAPVEQYQERGRQGPWTDVYALGATMYRMLTGVKPQPSVDRITSDQLRRPSELGIEIPNAAEKALMRSMAIRADNRIQTTEEFARAILNEDDIAASHWKAVLVFVITALTSALLTWGCLNFVIDDSLPFADVSQELSDETEL